MEPVFFKNAIEMRAWLEAHHATAPELVVGYYKKGAEKTGISYFDSLDEALCFGWIDGVTHGIDEHSYSKRFTPRRAGSVWSAVNIRKAEGLVKRGRMAPAGLRAFEARDPAQTGRYSFEQKKAPELSEEYAARFRADRKAWARFQEMPQSYRTAAIHWVTGAKHEETRLRRLATLMWDSRGGRKIAPLAWAKKNGPKNKG